MVFTLIIFLLLPLEKDTLFVGNGTWGPYPLSPFIIENSVDVTLNGDSVPYSLSLDRGILFFNHPIAQEDTIGCRYMTLPFHLKNEYFIRAETEDTACVTDVNVPPEASGKPAIRFGGEKRFGISLGSRKDFSIDQATKLSLEGQLSENVRIEGELSDENLPIQPEGTTQNLQDFESAYIKVGGKNSSLLLGDVGFYFNPTQSFEKPIERKVEGINMKFNDAKYSFNATASLAKGVHKTARFEGREGKQGPYILSDKKTVVAGSERVYVDGRELQRGKEYQMDYPCGELEFTTVFPISGGEEILVYFEEGNADYKREIYGVEAGMAGGLSINAGVFRETDDARSPLTLSFSEEDKRIIASSEDSVVWLPGSRHVGENKGDYIMSDSVFVYTGYKRGDWDVRFTDVGEGDYDYNNLIGGFEYVGEAKGRFIPFVRVPLPCAHTLSVVSLDRKFGSSTISVEGLISINDINTLRKGDEKLGSRGNFSYKNSGDIYELETSLWSSSKEVYYPDKRERWGRGYGVGFGFNPKNWFLLGGYIEGGDTHKGNLNLKIGTEKTGIEYNWNKRMQFTERYMRGYYRIKGALPYVFVGDIERNFIKSRRYGAGIKNDKLGFEIANEVRDTLTLLWETYETIKNAKIGFHPPGFDINLIYKRGKKWGEDINLLLGNLSGFLSGKYANLHLAYDLSRKEKTLYEEIYYEVEERRGSFSRDSLTGKYYPDEYGNYERRYIPLSSPQLVNEFFFQHTINLLPMTGCKITIATVKSGEGDKISFWQRLPGVSDRNSVNARISLKDDFLSSSYSKRDVRDGRTLGSSQQRQTETIEILLKPRFGKTCPSIGYYTENSDESYMDGEEISKEQLREVRGKINYLCYDISFFTALSLGEQKVEDYLYSPSNPGVRFQFFKVSPSFLYRGDKREINAGVEITDRWELEGLSSMALKSLYPLGVSYLCRFSLTIMPGGNVHYCLNYEGKKRREYPFDHNIKLEARMLF
ncbi:hypothetical protein CH333_01465 [candidate division WOR-3 bacterium JGI_Cruoil_03_44_89]|uniref:Uncharacterized protein n=1 Tax=candidate division WOR-3 bacterium JGI_Cruoil_03_44_89 TaxID=1973748 RepID=A0A235BYF7_UNCW3|nr:MAG: hypothetical protein CH333_01465 [candidate division WOR-3 bacterium JGI_Cruoil_03_44_89]